jgi:hypothetical protein
MIADKQNASLGTTTPVWDGEEVRSGFDHSRYSPIPVQTDDNRFEYNTASEIRHDSLHRVIHVRIFLYRLRLDWNGTHSIYCIHNLQKHGEGKVAYMMFLEIHSYMEEYYT